MKELKLGVVESKFAGIIWQYEPLSTTELIKLSFEQLNWKRTTTYTVLKRLCERGIFQTRDGIVTSLISQNDYNAIRSKHFVDENFNGSLPTFIASFTTRSDLSAEDVAEIKKLIESC